jgi:hypothetical protein
MLPVVEPLLIELNPAAPVVLIFNLDLGTQYLPEPRRRILVLRGLGGCFVGPTFHVNSDKQLNSVQHLICQRTQQKVRAFYLTIHRAQSCLEHSFSDSARTSQKDRRDSRPRSPIQETSTPSYTLVRRKAPTEKSHQHGSERKGTYREPRKKHPGSAVDQAPSGRRFECVEVIGGRDISPAGLPKRIPVSPEYQRNRDWREFVDHTKNQGQRGVEVFTWK